LDDVPEGNVRIHAYFTHAGRLFQEWLIDMFAKTEAQRLMWVRHHQKEIRADLYNGVRDAVEANDRVAGAEVGRKVILPSSFTGGNRHMVQLYQDAMAIVRKYGKPDLFITFTCNPGWPEITRELPEGLTSNDMTNIVNRVFRMKLKALLKDLVDNGIFGRAVADVHTVEWQKRCVSTYFCCEIAPTPAMLTAYMMLQGPPSCTYPIDRGRGSQAQDFGRL
jgi:hypothetical protein